MLALTREVRFALEAVRQAALLVAQIEKELVSTTLTKEDRSPVTVADYASQAVITAALQRTLPEERLVAEEESGLLRAPQSRELLQLATQYVCRIEPDADENSLCRWIERGNAAAEGRFWTLDPLDGTKGFLRGDQYAVALALVEDGVVQLGVLGCPKLTPGAQPDAKEQGALFVARRGHGAWVTSLERPELFRRLRVSQQTDLRQARLLRSFESEHTDVERIEAFVVSLGIEVPPQRMDSQAKYALLADGQGEFLLRLRSPSQPHYCEKIWDQAAGSLLVEEAGGKVTDLHGKELDFSQGRTLSRNYGVLASNGILHAQALAALKAIGAIPENEA
ncbi:MAG: 3'(2'),5'-bisphosphate nucleotidase [Anaerolineales bacterium]|nr:3'(2'),5'-bisphosphate nucleotidase [Anaerolineales bacterium]MDW8161992.1 3'(2'),5'-bisphosphate nucleotidase [Anaerolineales bacterium]